MASSKTSSKASMVAKPKAKTVVATPIVVAVPQSTLKVLSVTKGKVEESAFDPVVIEKAMADVGGAVLNGLKHIQPDQATVEFGLKFSAGTGGGASWLVDAGAEAHIVVTLVWEKEKSAAQPKQIKAPMDKQDEISETIRRNSKAGTEGHILSELLALGHETLAIETNTESRPNHACSGGSEARKRYRINLGNGNHSESWHSDWACA